ncbi:peptidase inhibitor family I36 protein [Pseudoclavibacter sp. 8L]|uniref:peptidase inhibitor family I36 protein n=1 Tax=Pseudoclavibacter sp. 8L TaxID=2653162 RepID=UPI0012F11ED3|nr:peptidase inhibitor family I36 protein [Pseudoclavibacter sp. 8L]VXC03387.1 conserved exported hypothetical protein [Pseudoclavibacter sp. 8L]
MKSLKKVLAAAAVTAGLATSAVVFAAPASAGTGSCSVGHHCVWEKVNFDGAITNVAGRSFAWMYYDFWNDEISSMNNRTSSYYMLYEHNNFKGKSIQTHPNSMYSYLPMVGMDNIISSSK